MDIRILILEGKHYTHHYNVTTPKLMQGACMQILKNNDSMGYYFDEDKIKADEIIEKNDGRAAIDFVMERSGYEYEGITVETLEEVEWKRTK